MYHQEVCIQTPLWEVQPEAIPVLNLIQQNLPVTGLGWEVDG